MTKVIFRKFKDDGQIIALFPELATTNDPGFCLSYMHIGQHSDADLGIIGETIPASHGEYQGLLNELISIGYDNLKIMKKVHYVKAYQARRDAGLMKP